VAKLLLCHQVELDAPNKCGSTPLALAAYRGHADIVDWLLARKANPKHKNNIGRSVVGYAISGNHVDVVRALLRASATLDTKDNYGSTLLCMAGGAEVAQFLVDRGADINVRNSVC
jgi:uncharacterized protein